MEPTVRPSNYPVLPEVNELSEQIGEFVYYWGFKRIHGRIWTQLFLAETPLDAADLVRSLDISKALVSISLRELMDYEVIEFAGKSTRATQLYRVNPNLMKVIMSILRQREKRMLSRILSAHDALDRVPVSERTASAIGTEKLKQLGDLINKAVMGLDTFMALQAVDFADWKSVFSLDNDAPRHSAIWPAI